MLERGHVAVGSCCGVVFMAGGSRGIQTFVKSISLFEHIEFESQFPSSAEKKLNCLILQPLCLNILVINKSGTG